MKPRYAEGTTVPVAKSRLDMQHLLDISGCQAFGFEKTESGDSLFFKLAGQYGVSIAAIRAARGGAVGVKFAGRFKPLCMDAEELAEWSGGATGSRTISLAGP